MIRPRSTVRLRLPLATASLLLAISALTKACDRPRGGAGESCQAAADCDDGLRCVAHVCTSELADRPPPGPVVVQGSVEIIAPPAAPTEDAASEQPPSDSPPVPDDTPQNPAIAPAEPSEPLPPDNANEPTAADATEPNRVADTEPSPAASEHPVAAPKLELGQLTIQGALDHDIVTRMVRARVGALASCAAGRPVHRGERAVINFVISGTGKVGSAVTQAATVSDQATLTCLIKATREWKFPRPNGGTTVIVTYPLTVGAS